MESQHARCAFAGFKPCNVMYVPNSAIGFMAFIAKYFMILLMKTVLSPSKVMSWVPVT